MNESKPEASAKRPIVNPEAPVPSKRVKDDARGAIEVEVSGLTWVFADYVPALGPVWDRLYDQNCLAGYYRPEDLQLAAYGLLTANYYLTCDEAVALIRDAPIGDIKRAVELALFGPEQTYRSWSDWASASFAANGLSFDGIPAESRQPVLELLVATQRTVPPGDWVSSHQAAKLRAGILAIAGRKS